MRSTPALRKVAFLAIAVFALCAPACNNDSPTGPKPVTSYKVYTFNAEGEGVYYEFTPAEGKLDSFVLSSVAENSMVASADGASLYLGFRDSIVEYSSDTKERIGPLPAQCVKGLVPSADNSKLAARTATGIVVLDRATRSVLFEWTGQLSPFSFSADSRKLYTSTYDTVRVFDIEDSAVVASKRFRGGYITKVAPSPDESQWLVYLYRGECLASFEVYDIALDSVVFSRQLSPGIGEFEVSPSGNLAYVTNSDQLITYCYPVPSEILVYDFSTHAIIRSIRTNNFGSDTSLNTFGSGYIEITPDSKWLVGIDQGYNYIIAIDLTTELISHYVEIDNAPAAPLLLRNLTCQNGN